MAWIWIVSWAVITVSSGACPQPEPQPDEYGIKPSTLITTLALCSCADTTAWHMGVFTARAEADTFIARAPRRGQAWASWGSYTAAWTLDSAYVDTSQLPFARTRTLFNWPAPQDTSCCSMTVTQ